MSIAFVAGATGYTGREVVKALVASGVRTVAHVRPDSPRLSEWKERFTAQGAEIDVTPWELGALTRTLEALAPTQVFALLGTTRRRAKGEGMAANLAYERIDYGLSVMLLAAASACGTNPRFLYLSAAGVSESTKNPYMKARARVEAAVRAGHLPYTIARPSFITGSGRDEARPGERVGAAVSDVALAALGLLGGRHLRARYRSTDATTLGRALARLASDPQAVGKVVDGDGLR